MPKEKPQEALNENSSIFLPTLNFRTNRIDGHDTHIHSHTFIEIFYVLSGKLTHHCNDKTDELTPGTIVFMQPGIKHQIERSGPCLYRNLCITTEHFKSGCDFLGEEVFPSIMKRGVYQTIKEPISSLDYLETQIRHIQECLNNERIAFAQINVLLVTVINFFIGRQTEKKQPFLSDSFDDRKVPQWFLELLSVFDKYDVIKYGIPEIKKHIFYSYSYVCRSFKKYTGKTLLEFLNEIRLSHAKFLLKNTDLSILDIADSIGFSSIGYFNRLFKRCFQITPFTYRKKAQSNHPDE